MSRMSRTQPAPRLYRGISQEERRAERRRRLIAAGIAVYGERGYRQSSVKAVCEAAGLTERYFYESFANSEELLVAAFNAVTYGVHQEGVEAAQSKRSRKERARAMLYAYFAALQREPHAARVFLVEIRGVSPAVDAAFEEALRGIARNMTRVLALRGEAADELLQVGVLGSIIQIATSWIHQGYKPKIDVVTDTALRVSGVLLGRTR
ncbi:TetR/AcrR family transcriptional regulator [Oxalobacteraceae bacterium OM1]|nr:TetR/AcrR family transcriptional regulator [Oxalobacteraceae bacterium OM1]